MSAYVLTRWEPENISFWEKAGSRVMHRDLMIRTSSKELGVTSHQALSPPS